MYNTELVKTPPTSWKELWDPKYKGKIAIPPAGAGPALHMAIMAAMVNGGSQYNMEPAWEALKALKPNVAVMEQSAAVLAELLRNGEVAIVMRTVYLFKPYIEKGYPIGISLAMKEGFFGTPGCAAIVKGHPDKRELADAFVNETLERGRPDEDGALALVRADEPQGQAAARGGEVPGQHPGAVGRDHPGEPGQPRRASRGMGPEVHAGAALGRRVPCARPAGPSVGPPAGGGLPAPVRRGSL